MVAYAPLYMSAHDFGRYVKLAMIGAPHEDVVTLLAIALCESGGPGATGVNLHAYNPNATNAAAYGPLQMNEGLGSALFHPGRAASHAAATYRVSKFRYWGCGPDHGGDYGSHMQTARHALSKPKQGPGPAGNFPTGNAPRYGSGLVRRGNVRLAPDAMSALQCAQRKRPGIIVTSSYRSVEQQRKACMHVCGDPNGCPGRCAPPGSSCHQRGEAVDVANWKYALPALTSCGFNHPLPDTDPGHFSMPSCPEGGASATVSLTRQQKAGCDALGIPQGAQCERYWARGGFGGSASLGPQDVPGLSQAWEALTAGWGLAQAFLWLINPAHWVRVAEFLGGVLLVIIAFYVLVGGREDVQSAKSAAVPIAKKAALAAA